MRKNKSKIYTKKLNYWSRTYLPLSSSFLCKYNAIDRYIFRYNSVFSLDCQKNPICPANSRRVGRKVSVLKQHHRSRVCLSQKPYVSTHSLPYFTRKRNVYRESYTKFLQYVYLHTVKVRNSVNFSVIRQLSGLCVRMKCRQMFWIGSVPTKHSVSI